VSDDSDELLLEAASVGAWAAVQADALSRTLADAVQRVGRGECPILEALASRPAAVGTLLAWIREWTSSGGAPRVLPSPLTSREATILQGVATGSNSGVIAGELGLSEQTVKNYVADILQKVGARNRAQAAAVAVQNGWLEQLE
jgi:two-component system response regulator DesR